jgi:hypothetical protein
VTQDIDEPVALDLSLTGTAEGGRVMIRGLVAGAAVSGGRPLGEGTWRVDIGRIQDVRVRPRRGFTGSMNLALELRLADDTVADQRSVRLEWVGPNKVTALAPADTQSLAAQPGASDSRRPMRPEERQAIAALVTRGKELLRMAIFPRRV